MKKYGISIILGFLAVGAVALAQPAMQGHPRLSAARDSINQALEQLRAAKAEDKAEFGGHRNRAEQLLKQAEQEINKAAQYANTHEPKQKHQP